MKNPSSDPAGKKPGERRVLRSVEAMPPPHGAGVIGAETEMLQKLTRQLRLERAFLAAVLELMPVGVTLAEAPSGRLVLANHKLEELLRERFFAAPTLEQYSHWRAFRPDGAEYAPRQWPLARAILFGDSVRDEPMRIRRGDRTFGLYQVNASPIRDDKGLTVAAVMTLSDVTAEEWAQQLFGRFTRSSRRPR